MLKRAQIIIKFLKENPMALGILVFGILFRLIGSVQTHLVFDEQLWIDAAKKVSFSPENFHLVAHGAFHPYFEVYLIKLSTLLFSNIFSNILSSYRANLLSIRFLHVLLSSGTILLIYLLVKDGLGKVPATFAAAFVAFCQFHIHFSRTVMQTAPSLFFVTLSLLFFWKAVKYHQDKYIILTGISIGLGYLCEETAALLFVIFFIYLILAGGPVRWLKKRETYIAVFIFLLVISPDLYWNLTAQNSDVRFHLTRAAHFQGVSLLPSSLFIGELFLMFVKDLEAFTGGFGRQAVWALEYPTMHWVLGILCLFAVFFSLRKWKDDFVKLMITTFFLIFLFFTVFASSGLRGNFNFWWASICFIPAIVLVSDMFSQFFIKKSSLKIISVTVVFYLFCHSIYFLTITEPVYVRRPAFLAKYYIENGRNFLLKGSTSFAKGNFKRALKYDKRSVIALANLAECYKREGKYLQTQSIWVEAKMNGLVPSDEKLFLLDRGYVKEWLISGFYDMSHSNPDDVKNQFVKSLILNEDVAHDIKAPILRKIVSPSAFIDFKKYLKNPPNVCSFALTQIYSPQQQRIRFSVGADDGLTIWVNQKEIYKDHKKYLWFPDEDEIAVDLDHGWNEILLCVLYTSGQSYGFTFRLLDDAGNVIDHLEYKAVLPIRPVKNMKK